MTEAQAQLAIAQGWLTGIAARRGDISLDVLDNEAAATAGVNTWLRMTVPPELRTQATMGGKGTRRFENRGYISVELYVDVDQGIGAIAQLADDVRFVLESTSLASASGETVDTFGAGIPSKTTDGRWMRWVVLVPFLWWELR